MTIMGWLAIISKVSAKKVYVAISRSVETVRQLVRNTTSYLAVMCRRAIQTRNRTKQRKHKVRQNGKFNIRSRNIKMSEIKHAMHHRIIRNPRKPCQKK